MEAIKTILSSNDLDIKEEKLWEAVLKWASYQSKHYFDKYPDFDGEPPNAKRRKLNLEEGDHDLQDQEQEPNNQKQ